MAACENTSPQDVVCPEPDAAAKSHTIMEEYGYKIGKVIGTGSYGLVYEALLEKQKIQVAVKIISKKKAAGEYLNKFLPREVQVMKTLRHRHIINFYQAIETTSRVYLVLELAPSGDAVERLQKVGPLPECLAGKWFAQLARGMAYIHSKGIVHRDLKLENLLLDKKSNIKISDFGFAKVATQLAMVLATYTARATSARLTAAATPMCAPKH
nr:testis-specific serine kinase 4 [Eurycea tynerensis]